MNDIITGLRAEVGMHLTAEYMSMYSCPAASCTVLQQSAGSVIPTPFSASRVPMLASEPLRFAVVAVSSAVEVGATHLILRIEVVVAAVSSEFWYTG